jgi:beta-lactamase class A
VINEARALGLKNTTLDKEAQKTSAGDLATFLGSVYSGTIDINAENRSRLIDAMKRNVYRKGIPAGSSGTVADKVGFLDGLLHDASLVYSPKGDYVLVAMTDGSSWDKIAELTRKIESIR